MCQMYSMSEDWLTNNGSFIGKVCKLVNASTKNVFVKHCAAHLG